MKSIRFLLVLVSLLLFSQAAQATVIVYKGTGRITRGNANESKIVSTTLFFVVDFDTLVGEFVFAQNINGAKTIYRDGVRNYGYSEVKTSPTASKVFFTSADGTFAATNNFTFRGIRMGGVKAKVFLLAGAPAPATIPKTVTGSDSFATGNPLLIDGPFTISVDLKKTQFANLNTLTADQAVGAILNEYTAPPKNYTNALPSLP
jgi:hypothetical protein